MSGTEPTEEAFQVNPEAGYHPVVTEPRAVAACGVAITRTYAVFPYYEHRYGSRGRAFSSSDSAWLVTLADLPEDEAVEQIRWLGRVLAARGMPQLLLETHLGHLADALDEARPDGSAKWEQLRMLAGDLRTRRTEVLAQGEFDSLAAEFDAAVSDAEREHLPHTGQMLVAAVTDEASGIKRAVTSVVEWIADPGRFSDGWVSAVNGTVDAARGRC